MAKTPKRDASPKKGTPRTSIALMLLRQLTIHAMAAAKVPTVEIAKAFDLNRSFVIKQATLVRKPRNADERRIVKVAQDYEAALRRAGFSGLLKTDEDVTVVLAGGERPKLGKLVDRQAKKAKAPTKASKSAAKPKVKAEKPAPAPKVAKAAPKAPAKPKVKAEKPAPKVSKPKEKAPTKPKLADLAKPDPETLKVVTGVGETPFPAPQPESKPEPDPFQILN